MHNIVILGGNIAGVTLAHYLLREVLPSLNAGIEDGQQSGYKITLVSPSDHTFYKIVAPRAAVSTGKIPLDVPFASIPEGFSQYGEDVFVFVKGQAVGLNEDGKIVNVRGEKGDEEDVRYDSLVVATGTTSASPLWTLHGDYKKTKAAFEDLHSRLPNAQSVLIAGGGPAGVETAGEIAHEYKLAKTTILSGGNRLLPRLNNKGVSAQAEDHLKALNVTTIHEVRVSSVAQLPDGKTALEFNDGTKKTVDIYIDATGATPNTSFLPANWLSNSKRVAVDPTTLRATAAPAGVYSVGDVASYSLGGILDAKDSIQPLGYSIWSDLRDTAPSGVKVMQEKKYNQVTKDMQLVPIGPHGGVGSVYDWRVPNAMVWMMKSRKFFAERAPLVAAGGELS